MMILVLLRLLLLLISSSFASGVCKCGFSYDGFRQFNCDSTRLYDSSYNSCPDARIVVLFESEDQKLHERDFQVLFPFLQRLYFSAGHLDECEKICKNLSLNDKKRRFTIDSNCKCLQSLQITLVERSSPTISPITSPSITSDPPPLVLANSPDSTTAPSHKLITNDQSLQTTKPTPPSSSSPERRSISLSIDKEGKIIVNVPAAICGSLATVFVLVALVVTIICRRQRNLRRRSLSPRHHTSNETIPKRLFPTTFNDNALRLRFEEERERHNETRKQLAKARDDGRRLHHTNNYLQTELEKITKEGKPLEAPMSVENKTFCPTAPLVESGRQRLRSPPDRPPPPPQSIMAKQNQKPIDADDRSPTTTNQGSLSFSPFSPPKDSPPPPPIASNSVNEQQQQAGNAEPVYETPNVGLRIDDIKKAINDTDLEKKRLGRHLMIFYLLADYESNFSTLWKMPTIRLMNNFLLKYYDPDQEQQCRTKRYVFGEKQKAELQQYINAYNDER